MGQQESKKLEQAADRMKIFKKIKSLSYNNQLPYVILLVGGSRSGKSSFLKMICTNDEQRQKIKIGDNMNSCTKQFEIFEINNPNLFGKRNAYILDSIGFGDTNGHFDDITLLGQLKCKIMRAVAQSQMRVDTILIFQSCKDPIKIKPLINDLRLCFGEEIQNHSLICLTKKNALNNEDLYDFNGFTQQIKGHLKQINFSIPVIDLFTSFVNRGGSEIKPDTYQMQKQQQEIKNFLEINNEGINFCSEWNESVDEAKKLSKKMMQEDIKKKFHEKKIQYEKNQEGMNFFEKIKYQLLVKTEQDVKNETIQLIIQFYEEYEALSLFSAEEIIKKKINQKKFFQASQTQQDFKEKERENIFQQQKDKYQ